tara:strand:+ start:64 stop:702 length:639 start_codon:yes stop_codon:yes gene_type:complete
MKKAIVSLFLVSTSFSLFSLQSSIDFDSWTIEVGKVVQPTCMYSLPSSSSSCLTILDRRSFLSSIKDQENYFIRATVTQDNPNYRCEMWFGETTCTGGEAFLSFDGWVPSRLYEKERYRDSCDYFVERTILLDKPDINCSGSYCEVSINYSPVPGEIKVSAEIKKYDANGRFLGREEEEETDFSPNGTTDVRFWINDKVKKVIVSDVNCEKW